MDRRTTSIAPGTPSPTASDTPGAPADLLSTLAAALAERLPGGWTSSDLDWHDQAERRKVTDFLWDLAAMDHVVFTYHLARGALLTAGAFTQLLVIDRPTRPGQFFVGALTPLGLDIAGREVPLTPHGIAVPRHPARAAYAVASRLLPAYYTARHALLSLPPPPAYRPGSRTADRPPLATATATATVQGARR
ncbi:hypothetical protein [Streptomyces sp. HPF1205]|uniref:hypothetical protein n=1 Tax=Streptomyces sp. HPF1205 TaxID=2873262 RepID=UPI001CECEF96|nr:hypothetical protein [Streptomyces sp. HPF1205]